VSNTEIKATSSLQPVRFNLENNELVLSFCFGLFVRIRACPFPTPTALARLYLKKYAGMGSGWTYEGLDDDTEQDVFKALANFTKNKTVVMVMRREPVWVGRCYL